MRSFLVICRLVSVVNYAQREKHSMADKIDFLVFTLVINNDSSYDNFYFHVCFSNY